MRWVYGFLFLAFTVVNLHGQTATYQKRGVGINASYHGYTGLSFEGFYIRNVHANHGLQIGLQANPYILNATFGYRFRFINTGWFEAFTGLNYVMFISRFNNLNDRLVRENINGYNLPIEFRIRVSDHFKINMGLEIQKFEDNAFPRRITAGVIRMF